MRNYYFKKDGFHSTFQFSTALRGEALLQNPFLNKGTTFSIEERNRFHLEGLLPFQIETISDQMERVKHQWNALTHKTEQKKYLHALFQTNQTLFHRFVAQHLETTIPILYTPTIAETVMEHSKMFQKPFGLYLSCPERDHLSQIFSGLKNKGIDLIIMTDNEAILGIGDQGIGGIEIPIGKQMMYTLCAGIHPARILPITLDVGTNNPDLLAHPAYLGWKNERIDDLTYYGYMDHIMAAIHDHFPNAVVHFEDFGKTHAFSLIERYQSDFCVFNDDVQGTGVVTLSAILRAHEISQQSFKDSRFVIYGAGTSGLGITRQIIHALVHQGLSEQDARDRCYLIDKQGLITEYLDKKHLLKEQLPFAKTAEQLKGWSIKHLNHITLLETVQGCKPTLLMGCSGHAQAFTPDVIRAMVEGTPRPLIFPLSNPTRQAEATPEEILTHSEGRAIVATGSPFAPVQLQGKTYPIDQCNNAIAFPGIGLSLLSFHIKQMTPKLLLAASDAVHEYTEAHASHPEQLLPKITEGTRLAKYIALKVAQSAEVMSPHLSEELEKNIWNLDYLPIQSSKD